MNDLVISTKLKSLFKGYRNLSAHRESKLHAYMSYVSLQLTYMPETLSFYWPELGHCSSDPNLLFHLTNK
jgi:hypothetical protein